MIYIYIIIMQFNIAMQNAFMMKRTITIQIKISQKRQYATNDMLTQQTQIIIRLLLVKLDFFDSTYTIIAYGYGKQ